LVAGKKTKANRPPIASGVQVDYKRVAGAFLLIVIIIEVGALSRWIAYPAYPGEIQGDPSWKFAKLESALFHSFGLLSPVFVVLLAFSFLYRWYILDGVRKLAHTVLNSKPSHGLSKQHRSDVGPRVDYDETRSIGRTRRPTQMGSSSQVVAHTTKKTLTSKHLHRGLLALALVVAPLLMIYPHLPMINPGGEGVSTDEIYYMRWMSELRTGIVSGDGTWSSVISDAFTVNKGDRPLTLILILVISNLTGMPDLTVIRFLPVALAPALVASNYLLLRHTLDVKQYGISRVKVFASIGAVFAVFSPQIVVGEYSGFLANWLALTAAYFAFYLIIRVWESSELNRMLVSLGVLFAILITTMLIHLYTWTHLLAVIALFAGLSYVMSRKSVSRPKMKVMLMLVVVFASFSIDYARSLYLGTPAATESGSAIASNIQAHDPSTKWERLDFMLSTYVGGFLSNPAMILLCLVWAVKAKANSLNILMLSMIFILAVPVAIGSVEFQTRVLYNTPVHIGAALALLWTGGVLGRKIDDKILQKLLILCIILFMASYALRALTNMPLQLPEGVQFDTQTLLSQSNSLPK
ncbi:MAG: hypothetical protein ACREBU_07755, partial [Nitrososphaera sp.]